MPRPNLKKAAMTRTVGDRHGPKNPKKTSKTFLIGDAATRRPSRRRTTEKPKAASPIRNLFVRSAFFANQKAFRRTARASPIRNLFEVFFWGFGCASTWGCSGTLSILSAHSLGQERKEFQLRFRPRVGAHGPINEFCELLIIFDYLKL